jgi:phosphatidylglycerophosphatase A
VFLAMTVVFHFVDTYKWWPIKWFERKCQSRYPLDVIVDDLVGAAMIIVPAIIIRVTISYF